MAFTGKPLYYGVGILLLSAALTLFSAEAVKIVEVLDHEHKYSVGWEVDIRNESIVFDLTVETRGYVGFGISNQGGMTGADIIVAGVLPDGTPYIGDYHGTGNNAPVRDHQQDWVLLHAAENETHTILKVFRRLNTCDLQDVAITNDTTNLIWTYGATDELAYHSSIRGTHVANLLDPEILPHDISELRRWDMSVVTTMPHKSFAYWCTIHKTPKVSQKNHIVGFKPLLDSALAVQHTHHFVIYRCDAPDHNNTIFEPFIKDAGGECYSDEEMARRPTAFCTTVFYVWGAGGKDLFLPDHVGYPIGEEQGKDEYFMLEVHYDNPQILQNVQFRTGVEILYTDKLRQYDAGMMTVGHTVIASLMLPPESKDFKIVGHCTSECTKRGVPKDGFNIFSLLLHTHLAGRKMKLRHFRGDEELPWISKDDSYHFNYQKNRPLREERKILPGDHLTFECTYDTTGRSKVTVAGYSTRDEMCEAFLWYYPKIPMQGCSSFYDISRIFPAFGIRQVKWNHGFNSAAQPTVVEPGFRRNETFAQYIDNTVHWTEQEKAELQKELHFGPHIAACPTAMLPGAKPEPDPQENQVDSGAGPKMPELASYPDVRAYKPAEDGCPRNLPVM